MLADVDEMYVAKGKRVVHVDLRSGRPSRNDLLELLLGPTGNLRATDVAHDAKRDLVYFGVLGQSQIAIFSASTMTVQTPITLPAPPGEMERLQGG